MKKYMVLAMLLSFFYTGYGMMVGQLEYKGNVIFYHAMYEEKCDTGLRVHRLFLIDDKEIEFVKVLDEKDAFIKEEKKLDFFYKKKLSEEIKKFKMGGKPTQKFGRLLINKDSISLETGDRETSTVETSDEKIGLEEIIDYIKRKCILSPSEKIILENIIILEKEKALKTLENIIILEKEKALKAFKSED